MSNPTKPGGFRWVGNKYAPNAKQPPLTYLPIASAYGTSIYRGTAVKLATDGTIQAASAGDTIYGVFSHLKQVYDSASGFVRPQAAYIATVTWGSVLSRQTIAAVIPVRGQIFRAQADEATTATTQAGYEAFVQENVEWIAGTAVGDQAGDLLDISTHATTNTLSVRIENVVDKELTDFASTGVTLEVSFNLMQDTASGSTTGT